MKLFKFLAAAAIAAMPTLALAQSSPNLTKNQVPTAGQWNSYFAAKQDVLGYVPLNNAGGTLSGRLVTAAPGATVAGLNLSPGTAPGSPVNGDIWVTATGLFVRVNGTTIGPLGSPSFVAPLQINLNAAPLPSPQTGAVFQASQADATVNRVELDSWGAASFFTCIRADGTAAAQTTLVANDEICSVNSWGYDGTSRSGPTGALRLYAGGTWSGASHPTYIDFANTPVGSTTLTSRVRIETDGGVTLNGSSSNGAGTITGISNLNGPLAFYLTNSSTGVNALSNYAAFNSASNASFGIGSTGYTGQGGFLQNRAFMFSNTGASGISIYATGAVPIDFYVNNTRAGGFTSGGAFTLGAPLAVASGGTNCAAASATCLDNITAFASTGFLNRTGAGAYSFVGSNGSGNVVLTTGAALVSPAIGAATGTSLALNGCSLGGNTFCFTGNATLGGTVAVISSGSAAFVVGPNGATNPVFQVDASVASQAAGLKITGNAAGGGTGISVIDSATNSPLSINAKGTGTITIGNASTGAITLGQATTLSGSLTYGGVTLSNSATGTGSMVLSTNAVLTTPNLGTPSSVNLANGSNLPIGGISSLGTGVGTALALGTNAASGLATTSGVQPWTPVITASTTPGTPVYAVQVGSYERIANTITAWFDVQLTSWGGSPAGSVTITGLPTASGGTANDYGGCVMSAFSGFATNLGWLTARVAPSSTVVTMLYVPQTGATATALLTFTQITPGTNLVIMGKCTYHI